MAFIFWCTICFVWQLSFRDGMQRWVWSVIFQLSFFYTVVSPNDKSFSSFKYMTGSSVTTERKKKCNFLKFRLNFFFFSPQIPQPPFNDKHLLIPLVSSPHKWSWSRARAKKKCKDKRRCHHLPSLVTATRFNGQDIFFFFHIFFSRTCSFFFSHILVLNMIIVLNKIFSLASQIQCHIHYNL